MSLTECNSALKQLRELQAAHRSIEQAAIKLGAAASAIVNALRNLHADAELSERADQFAALTARGTSFDKLRQKMELSLGNKNSTLHVPDLTKPPLGPTRVAASLGGGGPLEFTRHTPRRSRVPVITDRLKDPEWLRRHLEDALIDGEQLLRSQPSRRQESLIRSWYEELQKVLTASVKDHLFACHLLKDCATQTQATLKYINEDPSRCAKILADVTEFLLEGYQETRGSGARRYRKLPVGADWFCDAGATPPPEFAHGPLRGNQRELSQAICRSMGHTPDPRTFQRLARNGVIWVKRYAGQMCEVYFKDQGSKASANLRLLELRVSKEKQKMTST